MENNNNIIHGFLNPSTAVAKISRRNEWLSTAKGVPV